MDTNKLFSFIIQNNKNTKKFLIFYILIVAYFAYNTSMFNKLIRSTLGRAFIIFLIVSLTCYDTLTGLLTVLIFVTLYSYVPLEGFEAKNDSKEKKETEEKEEKKNNVTLTKDTEAKDKKEDVTEEFNNFSKDKKFMVDIVNLQDTMRPKNSNTMVPGPEHIDGYAYGKFK